MKYAYRDSNGYPGLDPDRLAAELDKIREKDGLLTPQAVIDEARSTESSLLRPYIFDKNIKEAAEEYYLDNARRMIRSIYVILEENPDWKVPANINIRGDGESARGYYPAATVMGNMVMREEALRRVWENLSRLRRLYSHMEQFASVWKAIDMTAKKVVRGKK